MESITSHIGVVVVAGGSGSRMGGNLPKQFMLLDGQPILARTINNFAEALPGAEIVVVPPADYIDFWQDYARRFDVAEHRTTAGGAERFHSVANGIAALSDACDLIAVQDGVRPLATHEAIRRIARTAEREGSAIPVVQPVDSFRIVTAEGASHPVERATLRIVQTPQFFRAELLRKAYACTYDPAFTDDATVVEAAGGVLRLVEGETTNLKITTRDDLAVAEPSSPAVRKHETGLQIPVQPPYALPQRVLHPRAGTHRTGAAFALHRRLPLGMVRLARGRPFSR